MATMTESLSKIAPNTVRFFASWLMEGYGMSLKEFENAIPKRKYYEVSKFFGYPLIENTTLSVSEIIQFIKTKFEEYEQIIIRYPDGVPNPLTAIKEMNHAEREIWIAKSFKRVINISLYHSLVAGNKIIRVSIADALKKRSYSSFEMKLKVQHDKDTADQLFWENIIKNFDKNEIIPF